jgi:alanine racemase
MKYFNTWCEISRSALINNLTEFKKLAGNRTIAAPVVKANAYGHGIVQCAKIFEEAGADWLCVNELEEASVLRNEGLKIPIFIIGPVNPDHAEEILRLDVRCIAYNMTMARKMAEKAEEMKKSVHLQIKVETGTNRMGMEQDEILSLLEELKGKQCVEFEGLSMHYADIEDTTDHSFAMSQLTKFREVISACETRGFSPGIIHASNTAATILWPQTYFQLIRFGIGAYGMWPSKETYITALHEHRHKIHLKPAIRWKTRIAQIKDVAASAFIGYGRTYRTTHDSRIAVLPVGYYDGYDRRLSNNSYVLIRGKRAQVRGRICMNMCMVDVTDIPDSCEGDEVILLGHDKESGDTISAEHLASLTGTINYEITSRINERIPRIVVE